MDAVQQAPEGVEVPVVEGKPVEPPVRPVVKLVVTPNPLV